MLLICTRWRWWRGIILAHIISMQLLIWPLVLGLVCGTDDQQIRPFHNAIHVIGIAKILDPDPYVGSHSTDLRRSWVNIFLF